MVRRWKTCRALTTPIRKVAVCIVFIYAHATMGINDMLFVGFSGGHQRGAYSIEDISREREGESREYINGQTTIVRVERPFSNMSIQRIGPWYMLYWLTKATSSKNHSI